MKRRSLIINALWGSVLTIAAPVRAAFVSNSKLQTDTTTNPYEAVKTVYDGFAPSYPGTELVFDEPHVFQNEDEYDKVFCKMVSPAGDNDDYHDVWLIFNDTNRVFADLRIKSRELIVAQLVKKDVYLAASKEVPDVEEKLRSSWRQSGRTVVSTKDRVSKEFANSSFETGPIFKTHEQYVGDIQLRALTHFLNLVAR